MVFMSALWTAQPTKAAGRAGLIDVSIDDADERVVQKIGTPSPDFFTYKSIVKSMSWSVVFAAFKNLNGLTAALHASTNGHNSYNILKNQDIHRYSIRPTQLAYSLLFTVGKKRIYSSYANCNNSWFFFTGEGGHEPDCR